MAGTSTGTLNVSATVNHSCRSLTTAPLSFPDYRASEASPTDASTQFSVRCTMGTPVNIGLDKGVIGAAESSRQLANGSSRLSYNLYTSAARTTVWDNASTRISASGQGLGTDMSFTVYGRIPAGQYGAAPGAYTDTITVVVSY
ncbi:MAG: spore coat U domain-containing protein [Burkholderiaceae bacterium]